MVAWPTDLPPAFESSDYRDELPDPVNRSDARAATAVRGAIPAVHLPPLQARHAPLQGEMIMTLAQVEDLDTFYADSLGDGALAFDFPDPDDEAASIRVSFTRPYPVVPIGGDTYRVRLLLERQY